MDRRALIGNDLRAWCVRRSRSRNRVTPASASSIQAIVALFGPGHGLADMVDRVVEYCDRHVLLEQLLTEIKQINPGQYARFLEPESSEDRPAPPTPGLALSASDRDTLTISHPISLHLVRVPAGEFQMGSVVARDKHAEDGELPPHTVPPGAARKRIEALAAAIPIEE